MAAGRAPLGSIGATRFIGAAQFSGALWVVAQGRGGGKSRRTDIQRIAQAENAAPRVAGAG
ncbi:hypothetical protein ATO13_20209 [Stappia sp. 22II-S9-Z10]|nr:hypothetical protein ATO13_20209 [Stappia sp. 22II-S9-Z10]